MPTYVPYYDNAIMNPASVALTPGSARPRTNRSSPSPSSRHRPLRTPNARTANAGVPPPHVHVIRDDDPSSPVHGQPRTTLSSEYGCPASIIESIARAEGVSPSALSVATILPSSITTTDAILYYAYRYAKARNLRAPALVEALDFYSSSSSSTSDSVDTDDTDDEDDDEDEDDEDEDDDDDVDGDDGGVFDDTATNDTVDAANGTQQDGVPNTFTFNPAQQRPRPAQEDDDELIRLERERRQRVPIPDVKLGLGVVAVTWPPPSEASAIAVSNEKRRRYDGTTSDLSMAAAVRRRYRRASPVYGLPFLQDASGAPDSIVVHVAHYVVGPPVATYNSVVQYRRVMVATRASTAQLNDFLKHIIVWHYECSPLRTPSTPRPAHYALYRYVIRDESGFWNREEDRRARLQGSVFLHGDQMKTIIADMRRFLQPQTRRWYRRYGLPQRRSYLFYGPPGTGKTSTIRVLASTFRRSCCFLGMASGNGGFSNQSLADALSQLPKRAIIVLEDVDALFTKRRSHSRALTFSGLLNALDGVLSVDGVVTIMTTNHIDRLDEALLRAGRVDRRFYFGPPGDDVLAHMFRAFYYGAEDEVVQRFVRNVKNRPAKDKAKSIATLQLLFIDMREKTAEQCADGVDNFFDTYFPIDKEEEAENHRRRSSSYRRHHSLGYDDSTLASSSEFRPDLDDDGLDVDDDDHHHHHGLHHHRHHRHHIRGDQDGDDLATEGTVCVSDTHTHTYVSDEEQEGDASERHSARLSEASSSRRKRRTKKRATASRASDAGQPSCSRALNGDGNVGDDEREGNDSAAFPAEQDDDAADSDAEVDGANGVNGNGAGGNEESDGNGMLVSSVAKTPRLKNDEACREVLPANNRRKHGKCAPSAAGGAGSDAVADGTDTDGDAEAGAVDEGDTRVKRQVQVRRGETVDVDIRIKVVKDKCQGQNPTSTSDGDDPRS